MEPVNITYRIKLSEQVTEVFDYELDGDTFELVTKDITNPPAWTKLGFKQCPNCPLNVEEHPHCPMALQLHDLVQRFHQTRSIDEVELEIITEQRKVTKITALQNAISSMLGLLFPVSGCPKTEGMKPLARFHVPMASEEETVFHVAGMYLLAQYFVNLKNKNGVLSFDGLITMYDDLHIVNKSVASRLQAVTSSDSVKNAITLIDMYSSLIPMLLQDQLAEMRGFFSAYLPEGEAVVATSNYLEQAKAFKLELIPTDEELQRQEAEKLAAENESKIKVEDAEEDEAITALPEWLRKSMPKDKPPMPKFIKPETKTATGSVPESIKPQAEVANVKVDASKPDVLKPETPIPQTPQPEVAKLVNSEFVMSLSLEPIAEPVVEEKTEEVKVTQGMKPLPHAVTPAVSAVKTSIASAPAAPEKKKAVYFIPDDDLPKKPGAEPEVAIVEVSKEEDGGLKMIDFEP